MPDNKPPVTVSLLLAKVKQSTANIAAHRAAMADVAAQAATKHAPPAPEGGAKQ